MTASRAGMTIAEQNINSGQDARAGLAPGQSSGNDAIDRARGKGIYYVASSAPAAPSPAPPPPPPPPPVATSKSVKQPSPSLIQYSAEGLPQELITDLLYEDVGGSELINIARYDTVDGQDVSYSLVRNLSILNQSFNPNNILAGQIVYSSQLGQYALDLSIKINSVSLDADGNLVIDLASIGSDEYVEVEISSNGTIYKIGV